MVNYGKTLSGAIRFSFGPKRWLPIFVLDAVCFTIALTYLLSNASAFRSILSGDVSGILAVSSIFGVAVIAMTLYALWMLVRIYIVGALIHQSVKPKEFPQSWTVSKQRYLSLLAVMVVVGAISWLAGMIPYVGWLASIITGLVFFFAMPPAIVDKMSFDNAIKVSYNLFRNKLTDVFIAWLVIALISSIILFVFVIPVLLVAFGILLPQLIGVSPSSSGTELLMMLISNRWSLVPAALVFLIGTSIVAVFSIYAQTHFYIQLRKKGILQNI